ncbi:MAG: hypothetical protein PHP65_01460 [Bacilli bacterium]|nr:hypothetical protein [Bacilli bacterium]
MRRIVGFVFFIISSILIASIIVIHLDYFNELFESFDSEEFLPWAGIFIAYLWEILYQPMVILLLSVIAMGTYSK